MISKTLHFLFPLLAVLLLCCCSGNSSKQTMANNDTIPSQVPVTIDSTTVDGLIVYYPQYSRIDLVCGKMPGKQDDSIVFCAEAAFTHELLDEFDHSNIDGDHVSGGKRYKGAECKDNSGALDRKSTRLN